MVTVKFYNRYMLKPTDLVLVCLLPTPRYLEIARLLGWCRIPLCTAPKIVAVEGQTAFWVVGSN